MCRIQAHGNEQGTHLPQEILAHPAPLRGVAFTMRNDLDAVDFQCWQQCLVVQRVLPLHQVVQSVREAFKGIRRVGSLAIVRALRRQMGLSAHFKKLVEVGRNNAQEAKPLQHRHIGARGPAENALIKSDQTVVTVQQMRATRVVKGLRGRPKCRVVRRNRCCHSNHSLAGYKTPTLAGDYVRHLRSACGNAKACRPGASSWANRRN